jgi:hypothetical protein
VDNPSTPPKRTPLNFQVPHPFGFLKGAGLDAGLFEPRPRSYPRPSLSKSEL